jgi:RNA polymerase sigma-70 factor (ECF subfamily)
MDDQNLAQLIRESKNGNTQALEKLVASCQPAAFRLALSILDDPAEADDVAQETFIKAIRGITAYREEAGFKTWLYRIIVNDCLGKLRKKRARQRLNSLMKDNTHPENQVLQDESTGRLMQAVNSLDDDHRVPVVLRYYNELPIAQIATILDVSTRTVHTRLRQAHDKLREALGEYHGND